MREPAHATHEERLTVADEIIALLARDLTLTYEDMVQRKQQVGWDIWPYERGRFTEADLRRAWELCAPERESMGYLI